MSQSDEHEAVVRQPSASRARRITLHGIICHNPMKSADDIARVSGRSDDYGCSDLPRPTLDKVNLVGSSGQLAEF